MSEQKFLLVRLEAGLPQHRTTGLFHAIRQHPGVEMVCDLSMVSQATLDVILLRPTPLLEREKPSASNAVRRHNQTKRQAGLL